jgi:hypothetical protein
MKIPCGVRCGRTHNRELTMTNTPHETIAAKDPYSASSFEELSFVTRSWKSGSSVESQRYLPPCPT